MGFITNIKKIFVEGNNLESNKLTEFSAYAPKSTVQTESFKSMVDNSDSHKYSAKYEEHPFDLNVAVELYKRFGLLTGIIEKYIDFVVGPGFFVKSEDKIAESIIKQWMQDVNFDTVLRQWLRETLITGSGFIELAKNKSNTPVLVKVLDSCTMYLERDDKGNVKKYYQILGRKSNSKTIEFKPNEIAFLQLNKVGSCSYGLGLIYPIMNVVDSLIKNENDMTMLMGRKANTPIIATVGMDGKRPTPELIESLGKKLEWLNNKHEWVFEDGIKFQSLDFGNIGDKFKFAIDHYLDMIFFSCQVPEVLMGRGSIPEGLAKVQMDGFERRVQSIQAELEKVIENDIFNPILISNNRLVHVEFEWGQPSNTEKNQRIQVITQLLSLLQLNPQLRSMLEEELVNLLGLNSELLKSNEEQRESEEQQPQPIVPGSNGEHLCPDCYTTEKSISSKLYDGELV